MLRFYGPNKKTHSAERQTLLSILLTGHRRDNLMGFIAALPPGAFVPKAVSIRRSPRRSASIGGGLKDILQKVFISSGSLNRLRSKISLFMRLPPNIRDADYGP